MKGSILLLLVQLLLIIIISIVLCFAVYIYLYCTNFGPEQGFSFGSFISLLPSILLKTFPLTVIASVILSLTSSFRKQSNRILAILLTLAGGTAIYFFGYSALYALDSKAEFPEPDNSIHLYTGRINPLNDSSFIYLMKSESPDKYISVTYHDGKMDFSGETTLSAEGSYIETGSRTVDIDPPNPFFSDIFMPPPVLTKLIDDMYIFNQAVRNMYAKSITLFLITAASQVAFAAGCWTIIRLSGWPLLNLILAAAVIRIFPAYYRLSYSDLTQKAIGLLNTSSASDLAPAALLVVAALLLLLWDLIINSPKDGEIGGRK